MTKSLLEIDGVKYVLSEKFCQDPLEEHFGRQRRKGGCNENPTYQEFQKNELILNVVRSELISDLRGNTHGRDETRKAIDVNDTRKLLVKKRSQKK